jgi:segregation and condensation protein B
VEIEAIRGVEVIGPLDTLTQRKLITVVGRRESIGRPILYGTTSEFLRQFGLNSLDDLPKLESFNRENVAAAAQTTAVELIEQDAAEPLAEGAPPADPVQGAETAPEGTPSETPYEAPAEQPAAEEAAPAQEPAAETAPENLPAEEAAGGQPEERPVEEPQNNG